MSRIVSFTLLCAFVVASVVFFSFSGTQSSASAVAVSPHLVISQVQAGGGSNANDEFIEIFNSGTTPVDLNGHRVVYRSAAGTNDVGPMAEWTTSTILQPGQYYLIAATSYDGGITPDKTYDPSQCSCSMGANGGGLAIRQGPNNTGAIIDSVGWGSASNIFVETTVVAAAGNDNSIARNNNGCQDTDNNFNDFAARIPAAARNSATSPNACSGGGTNLFASMTANPVTVAPGGNSLITVTVIPATTPPSTGITVTGDLTNIGGAASQPFFDNGTNGDVTAGDNIYSYLATIGTGVTGGSRTISAVASDAQARTANMSLTFTINAPPANDNPLLFGNPSNATAEIANENNYLMHKPQYSLSYNRSKATANWVAWRLDSSWLGSAPRQDDFRPDSSLPIGWYQVTDNDYSGSGYTRGHMCPSGDRTRTIPDNSATFLMTNMVPQISENNSGSWNGFEEYTRSLANAGQEIYIYSGGVGNIGTIANGRIVVPQYTWKVVLIMPNGDNDLSRVGKGTRAFGIIVPNFPPLASNAPWRNFRVTVDEVEILTGYDFFTAIPKNSQELMERRRDRQ